jgi:addiction module RelE/StbE family toxin
MPAANQIQELFDFIASDNPAAAERTVRRIREAILRTSAMPNAGRIGRVAGTREVSVPGTSYVVAYRILDSDRTIHILAILHGAQAWPKSF